MSSGNTRLPALNPAGPGGRGPNASGLGSPRGLNAGNADMSAVMEDTGLRAENSDLGPRLSHPPPDPLPPRAESTPPDRDLPEGMGIAIDAAAWPSGNKRGGRVGGSGMWAIREGMPSQLKSHSPIFVDPKRDSARSYLWAHRSAAHATFKGRAAAGDGKLLPSASGKRLDDRLSRMNSPVPGATAWASAPGGIAEQDGTPMDWKELQHATTMASAQMMHEAPNAALTQIEISPGHKGSLSPEHLKQVHGMSETDIQRLYRAMRIYTLGFHEMMQDICSTASDRRGLLVKVWRLFGRLWDSSLQVVFDSEVLALGADRERALEQVTFLQRQLEAVNDENRMIRSKVNEMVNHALTRTQQDQVSADRTSAMQAELNRAKQIQVDSEDQLAKDALRIKEMEDEMHRLKKELYKAEAMVKAKVDELAVNQQTMSATRHEDDELRKKLKLEEVRANRAEEAAKEAEASRAAMYEEKEMATKTANAAKHDMFEERRAKRILQVDVEYVRGEIIERRQEVKVLHAQMKEYEDAKKEAEDHLRQAIAWRQHETDRAETYERDIQTLVVMFNHMQDEVALNAALKAEVQKYKSLLEEKRSKKRLWKERCSDARKMISVMKAESAEAEAIREAENKKHAQEVENLVRDVQQLEATNAELHERLKPLRVELSDCQQRMSQLQLARTSAKMRLEAANKRTAKLVDALSENIHILSLERDKTTRLSQELKSEREITASQKAELAFQAEEHVAECAKLKGEIKKAQNEGSKITSQLEYVRQQAREQGSDLAQQIEELNDGLVEAERERDAAEQHLTVKQHQIEVANKKIEELETEISEGKQQIREAARLQVELQETTGRRDKYQGWLQLVTNGVKEVMEELRAFLANEPLAPVGEDRAWNGIAEGTLGTAMGNEFETDPLVVDLDNNWDDLLQEKGRLMQVIRSVKADRDGLKDELNDFLVQREDKEMDMQNSVNKIRKELEVLNNEAAKMREHSTSMTVKIGGLTSAKTELEEKIKSQAELLRGAEAEIALLRKAQEDEMEKSKNAAFLSDELERSETKRRLLVEEIEAVKKDAMQLASYEQQVDDLTADLNQLSADLQDAKSLAEEKSGRIMHLEGEMSSMKAKERDTEQVANELADVKEQLILANASLDAKEIELIKAQATAGQNAGFIAEQLQGELHSLQSTSSHQIEELQQQLKDKRDDIAALVRQLSQFEEAGMTEEARQIMQNQHNEEKEHLAEIQRQESDALIVSLRSEIDSLKLALQNPDMSNEALKAVDAKKLQAELEEMKEAKEAAYRNLVKADDELADLKREVTTLERKLAVYERPRGTPGLEAESSGHSITTPVPSQDEMSAEVRSVVEKLAETAMKQNEQPVDRVWCSSMMQHLESEDILTDMLWSAESLKILISQIYCEKIEADLHDLRAGEPVQTLQEFVYDFFMVKTGIRSMGEVHLRRLIDSIEAAKEQSRVDMFGALVGHTACRTWPKSSEKVFISILSHVFSHAGGIPPTEPTEGHSDVERAAIISGAAAALPSMLWHGIENKLIAAGGGGTTVDLDTAMEIVMDLWLAEKQAEEERAAATFAKFDSTRDHLMPKSDFKSLLFSIEGAGVSKERINDLFGKLLHESAGMANDLIPGPVFRTTAWPIGIGGGSGYCKVEPPAALVSPVAYPEGMSILKDIVPTIGKCVDEICEALKETKSVASELENMRKLFSMVVDASTSATARGNEVWNPYRRFVLLLHISYSRKNVLLHESRAAQGAAGFSTKFGKLNS